MGDHPLPAARPAWRLLAATAVALSTSSLAADWPTYRHDNERSGVTDEELRPPLKQCWVFEPRHPPRPAWGDPNPRPRGGWYRLREKRRVHFDDAFHVVAADGALYFGSSADGTVSSLNAADGSLRWTALTGGPVRLAPALSDGRVYVGSDDGHVYCLRASDGGEIWRVRAAPNARKLLGNGAMVSLWPCRTGVLVADNSAYVGAGIFPAEGVYLYALRADDGQLVWRNDTCGEPPTSKISPQGYLLSSETTLFAPLGRTPPAAFDRKSGRLLYETWFGHRIGGTNALLAGEQLYMGTEEVMSIGQKTRGRAAWLNARQLVIKGDVSYLASDTEIVAVDRTQSYDKASVRRFELRDQRPNVERELNSLRRQHADLEKKLDSDRRKLDGLAGRLKVPEAGDDGAQAVALKAEHETLQKAVTAETAKLGELGTALDLAETRWQSMEAEWNGAAETMEGSARWRLPCECPESLILAGNVLYAGGDGEVVAVDSSTGTKLWTGQVAGKARGLAVSDGRLFVSTDGGLIHCFGAPDTPETGTVRQAFTDSPYAEDSLDPVVQAAAEHIVRTTGAKRGYCLVLGLEDGRLIHELAKRTELRFCAVDSDPDRIAAARTSLHQAGLYGARVSLEQADLSRVPFADFFADLVVSESALLSGTLPGSASEAYRMLKPVGGALCLGWPDGAGPSRGELSARALRDWWSTAGVDGGEVTEENGVWLTFTRGALPGAGSWTHQYAEAGNTACGDDQLVRCPLGLLWFGDPGPGRMASRNRRPTAPLAVNGRLFVQGEGSASEIGAGDSVIMAYDNYNGVKLWERSFPPRTLREGMSYEASNVAADADSLFVVSGKQCVRLDAATGRTVATYATPQPPGKPESRWGYLAFVDGLLFGTRTPKGRTGTGIFAVDAASGETRWLRADRQVSHTSISIADQRVFFVDRQVTDEQRRAALQARRRGASAQAERTDSPEATVQLAMALDAVTGKTVWQTPVDVAGAARGQYWHALATMAGRGVVVLFGVYTDGHYWKQFFADHFKTRRVVALSADDGRELWSKTIGYRVRPLIVGNTLHAEPWAYDLHTGEQRVRPNPITGREEPWQFARPGHHCGCPAASPHTMFFRSHSIGYYDLVRDHGITHFGGQRPSCWINFVPANGLLSIPEGGSACMCPFPTMCTLVFQRREHDRAWAYFSTPGPVTPVKHLALNLGAPGDRRDASGTLWFGVPRPGGSLVLRFDAKVGTWPGGGVFRHDREVVDIDETDSPWLYRAGYHGLRRCEFPLFPPEDGTALYTVRLGFAELENDNAGERVFDVKLNDRLVLDDFDPLEAAGGRRKAVVKEFRGVSGAEALRIELVPKAAKPTAQQAPILQTVEVLRERVVSLGLTAPSFLLNNAQPEQAGNLTIANHKDDDFSGVLRVRAPDGFAVESRETAVNVTSGGRATVALRAALKGDVPAGVYPVSIELVRADGGVEQERKAEIEYLGNRGRVVLNPVEDAHCQQSHGTRNVGTDPSLNIDGGDRKLGDHHHAVAYLKFRLDVPGTPRSLTLRLHNSGNPTGDSGRICLVTGAWSEKEITYPNRPPVERELVRIGPVHENQTVTLPLAVEVQGKTDLTLAVDPTGCDGVGYYSREGGRPPELVVEYEQ